MLLEDPQARSPGDLPERSSRAPYGRREALGLDRPQGQSVTEDRILEPGPTGTSCDYVPQEPTRGSDRERIRR